MRIIAADGVGAGVWPLGEALRLQFGALSLGKKLLVPCNSHDGEARLPCQDVEQSHFMERSWSVRGINRPPRRHRPPNENGHVFDMGSVAGFKPAKFQAGKSPQHKPFPDMCEPPIVVEPVFLMVAPWCNAVRAMRWRGCGGKNSGHVFDLSVITTPVP